MEIIESVLVTIVDSIPRLLNAIWAPLCGMIYSFISLFFDVLTTIPKTNILNSIGIESIYQRLTMIITIVMAFYITFEIVKYVVQPEAMSDKEKGTGKLALRLIAVILLIAFVPKIFSLAYELQTRIIDSQVISKIILGKNEEYYDTLGSDFSADVLSSFYGINEEVCNENTTGLNKTMCDKANNTVTTNLNVLRTGGYSNFALGIISSLTLSSGLELYGTVPETNELRPIINFNGFLALCVGVYITWTLIVYSVEVGKRYFQLIFLQISAPVAIISYISPKKDGTFQKWTKQCITTYLDLFIRLAIINFVLLILKLLNDSFFNSYEMVNSIQSDYAIIARPAVLIWVYILLIIGLLQFAKNAPKLLKELFPGGNAASGNFGMSGKEMFGTVKTIVSGTSRTLGGVVGGFTGFKTAMKSDHLKGGDRVWSAAKGAFMGAKTGFSKGGGIKKANAAGRTSVQKDEDIVLSGGRVISHDVRGGHYQNIANEQDRKIKSYENATKEKENVYKAIYEVSRVADKKTSYDAVKNDGSVSDADKKKAELSWKSSRKQTDIAVAEELQAAMQEGRDVDYSNIKKIKYDEITEVDENLIPIQKHEEEFIPTESDRTWFATIGARLSSYKNKLQHEELGELIIEVETTDEQGNKKTENKKAKDLTIVELAKYIGTIEEEAIRVSGEVVADPKYDTVHANASKPNNN